MGSELLLTILILVCVACLMLERKVAWLTHISGVCLIIIVALFLATFGIIPSQHPVYDFFTGPAIPIAIALMVMSVDLRELRQVPKTIAIAYGLGILGTLLGAVIATLIVARGLGSDAPLLAAQFSASYIGGGENAVAMQKIFNIPNALFVAGFAVDNLLTTVWMILTLSFARSAKATVYKVPPMDKDQIALSDETSLVLIDILVSLGLAFLSHQLAQALASTLGILHPVLYLTLIAFVFGQIPPIKQHIRPAYLLGCLLFAAFFFSIGAISDLKALSQLPWEVALMPFIVVGVHGIVIFGLGRWLRVPPVETALASQSLIGGPATAVALAQACGWKSGVSLGLVIGVLGYAIANYFGYGMFFLSEILVRWVNG